MTPLTLPDPPLKSLVALRACISESYVAERQSASVYIPALYDIRDFAEDVLWHVIDALPEEEGICPECGMLPGACDCVPNDEKEE